MHPEDIMFEGTLELDSHCRIGYVSQFVDTSKIQNQTVFDYIASPFIACQQTLEDICVQMESGENIEVLLEQYQEALDAFDAIGGDAYESLILRKLGLDELTNKQTLAVGALSGGEFKLIQVFR